MKKLLFLAGLFFAVATASAQAPLEKGGFQLNAGVGLSGWGVPISLGLDYGIGNDLTVGGELSYRSHTDKIDIWGGAKIEWNYTYIGILANTNYHFNRVLNIPSQYDLYGGLALGYFIASVSNKDGLSYTGSNASSFSAGLIVGGRYFFNDVLAANLELSGASATSGAKIGITYKF